MLIRCAIRILSTTAIRSCSGMVAPYSTLTRITATSRNQFLLAQQQFNT